MNLGGMFDIVSAWGASELEDQAGTDKIKTRLIGDWQFQFRKLKVKERFDLGAASLRMAGKLKGLMSVVNLVAAENEALSPDLDEVHRRAVLQARLGGAFMELLPKILETLGDPDVNRFVVSLAERAYAHHDGKFVKLSDPVLFEKVFEEDLTLLLPVAITVLEVNLDRGFIDKIGGIFVSQMPAPDLESGSSQAPTSGQAKSEDD